MRLGYFFVVFRQIEDLISCRLGAVCRTPLVQGTGLQGSDRVMALKETTGNRHRWVSVAPFGEKKSPHQVVFNMESPENPSITP